MVITVHWDQTFQRRKRSNYRFSCVIICTFPESSDVMVRRSKQKPLVVDLLVPGWVLFMINRRANYAQISILFNLDLEWKG